VTASRSNRRALLGTLSVLILTAGASACERDGRSPHDASAAPGLQCPAGKHLDPDRLARLRALLEKSGGGRDLLRRAPEPLHACFGEVPVPAITTGGVFLLDSRLAEPESASRFAHLLHHAVEGMPGADIGDRSRPCSAIVDDALRSEAEAHALELQLRRELGVTGPSRTYPFEEAFWAAPAERRVPLLMEFFRAHPAGAEGVPGFVEAYGSRCEEMRRQGSPR